jgi:hypothetical protein
MVIATPTINPTTPTTPTIFPIKTMTHTTTITRTTI